MSEKIVQLNEEVIKGQLKELVRGSVEETLNGLLEAEAEKLTQAGRYERSEQRQGYRSGHYNRNLMTTAGEVKLHVLRLKGVTFETAIIERYRRRESSVEEALMEMYLAGVSVRRVEDITETFSYLLHLKHRYHDVSPSLQKSRSPLDSVDSPPIRWILRLFLKTAVCCVIFLFNVIQREQEFLHLFFVHVLSQNDRASRIDNRMFGLITL